MKRRTRSGRKMRSCHPAGVPIGEVAPVRADQPGIRCPIPPHVSPENYMYIGGGTLGTILVVLLVLWLLGNVRSPRREQIIHKLWGHLGRHRHEPKAAAATDPITATQ